MAKMKAALITGCNGGIGKALCQEYKDAGYLIIGTDLHGDGEANSDLYICCDLVDLATNSEIQKWLKGIVCEFVGERGVDLQVIINNAAYQVVKPLGDLSVSDFNYTQQINVIAPYTLAHLFASLLKEAKGSIVNIGSIHSRLTKPGFCAYSTSKAALSGLTRALALEFSGAVTVNCILPAATATEMLVSGFKNNPEKYDELASYHPVGRIAAPAEIAHLALFLCSENARFITGSDIPIDGGIASRLHDPA